MGLLDEAEGHDAGAGAKGEKGEKGSAEKKKHRETLIVVALSLIGIVFAYLAWRGRSTSSTSTTAPGSVAGGSSTTTSGLQSEITTLVGDITKQNSIIGALQSTLTGQQAANSAAQAGLLASLQTFEDQIKTEVASSPQQAAAATATPSSTGPPTITIGGALYDVLGLATDIQFNVGGGAPVFFGNANGISQGPGQDKAGSYAYTLATYSNLVTPVAPGTKENVTQ